MRTLIREKGTEILLIVIAVIVTAGIVPAQATAKQNKKDISEARAVPLPLPHPRTRRHGDDAKLPRDVNGRTTNLLI